MSDYDAIYFTKEELIGAGVMDKDGNIIFGKHKTVNKSTNEKKRPMSKTTQKKKTTKKSK